MAKTKRLSTISRKLGNDRNELATKHRKAVRNFAQSRDIREDRGTRQTKLGGRKQPLSRAGIRL